MKPHGDLKAHLSLSFLLSRSHPAFPVFLKLRGFDAHCGTGLLSPRSPIALRSPQPPWCHIDTLPTQTRGITAPSPCRSLLLMHT